MTWIVPFPAGGTTDLLARVFAQKLTEALGQPVVIENASGGGGSIGADKVAKAAPDGYTLLLHNVTFSTTTSSLIATGRAKHTFDDFTPVSLAANVPLILMCHPSVTAKDLKEFVGYTKEQNKTDKGVFYGSTGPGSVMHLSGETLKRDSGIKMEHVPFRGAAPLVQELLSGRIQFGGDQIRPRSPMCAAARYALSRRCRRNAPRHCPTCRRCASRASPTWSCSAGTGSSRRRRRRLPRCGHSSRDGEGRARSGGETPARRYRRRVMGSTQEELGKVLRDQVAVVRPLVEELKLVVQ